MEIIDNGFKEINDMIRNPDDDPTQHSSESNASTHNDKLGLKNIRDQLRFEIRIRPP